MGSTAAAAGISLSQLRKQRRISADAADGGTRLKDAQRKTHKRVHDKYKAAFHESVLRAHTNPPIVHEQNTAPTHGPEIIFTFLYRFVQTTVQPGRDQCTQRLPHCRHMQRLNLRRDSVVQKPVPMTNLRDATLNLARNITQLHQTLR